MRNQECIHCQEVFDLDSREKKLVGGKINECPDCATETAIKYAGVQAADGKQSQATILKFKSENDKKQYLRFWKNNSGFNKGKSCQLGNHLSTTPDIKFETVVAHNPTNHKGRS